MPFSYENFEDMNLNDSLLRGIYAYGYKKLAPIQQQLIVPTIEGKDIIAQAQSGMGKTGFFIIGILQNIKPNIRECQTLIVVPTRELAVQTQKVVLALSKYIRGIRCRCITGGYWLKDADRLYNGVHIVVGTPGRIIQMTQQGHLDLSHLKTLVLDEADKLLEDAHLKKIKRQNRELSYDFVGQLKELRKFISKDIQTIQTSATMPANKLEVFKAFIKDKNKRENAIILLMKNELLTLEGISQYYTKTESKFNTLLDLFSKLKNNQTLIFCNTRKMVETIYENLPEDVEMWHIHGDMSQKSRDQIFKQFLFGQIRVLITSDLMARGIDIQQVSIVVNFDLPDIREQYIHRVGRAGRYGRNGLAISLINEGEMSKLDELQKFYNTQIEYMKI